MNDRLLTPGEILIVRSNISEIERTLGSSIPEGLISYIDIKDHLLTPGEILIICNNIKSIKRNCITHDKSSLSPDAMMLELIAFLAFLIIGGIVYLLG